MRVSCSLSILIQHIAVKMQFQFCQHFLAAVVDDSGDADTDLEAYRLHPKPHFKQISTLDKIIRSILADTEKL